MLKKILAALVIGGFFTSSAFAQFEIKELGLNDGGQSKNVTVIPQNLDTALGEYSFSYDIDEITFNHQYDAARHVINQLSWPDQTKIYVFWHNALIEKKLMAKQMPQGSVTLSNILSKSKFDTSFVKNRADFDAFIRHQYTQKLNDIVSVHLNNKTGSTLNFDVKNYSDFDISSIRGNIRVIDTKDTTRRIIYIDEDIEKSVTVPAGQLVSFGYNKPLRLKDWESRGGIAVKFTVTSVKFTNGKIFDADKFYYAIKGGEEHLDPYPFTELPKK